MKDLLERLAAKSEITAEDVIVARLDGDREALNEASLGRVYQHVKKSGDGASLGIVTAWLAEPGGAPKDDSEASKNKRLETNSKNQKKLKSQLKSAGLGFFKLRGSWDEVQDDGSVKPVSEPSLAVPGMTMDLAKKIRRDYGQNAVIYLGPETKGEAVLIFAGNIEKLGKFHPGKIAAAYSRVKGRPFIFEWITQSWGEAMIEMVERRKRGLPTGSRVE